MKSPSVLSEKQSKRVVRYTTTLVESLLGDFYAVENDQGEPESDMDTASPSQADATSRTCRFDAPSGDDVNDGARVGG